MKQFQVYSLIILSVNYKFIINIMCTIFFFRDQSLLVFNLGCLKIKSKPQNIDSIQSMHKKGVSQSEVLQEIASQSYDRFYIELENAQVCFEF